jgi:hypothetical protein
MQNLQQLPLRDFRAALGYDEESLVVPTLIVVTRVVCSYVGQEPVMFAQSLRENLTMVRNGLLLRMGCCCAWAAAAHWLLKQESAGRSVSACACASASSIQR